VSTTINRTKTVRDGKMWRMSQALKRDMPGVAAVAAVTAVGLWLGGRADLTNVPIAFLFVIAVVSMRFGYQAAILAAIASALCFDYFFLPPYGSLQITRSRDLLTDIAMLAVAVLVSTLNERLRREARSARLSERQTESLYALVRELADAHSLDSLNIAGMLVIDDWGLAQPRETEKHDLLEILEDRCGNRATIMTSQVDPKHWHQLLGEPTLADAIVDRIINRAHKIALKGPTKRKDETITT
jgi:hypothetical protein